MTIERKVGENTVNSLLEEFYRIWRFKHGFSGVELAHIGHKAQPEKTLGIRLFLTPASYRRALAEKTLPDSEFLGLSNS